MKRYAGRLVLPVVLLVAALVCWFVASQLGKADSAEASTSSEAQSDVPVVSVRRLPEFATASQSSDAMERALASLPADPGGLSCAAIWVDGQPVFQLRSDRPLLPAFAQLAITGHAALDVLGPDYTFETRVMALSGPDEEGTVAGGVYLVGGGDPVLMTDGYSRSFSPIRATRTPLEVLARAVADAGVTRIDGNVIAVEGRYDDQRALPGWPEAYLAPSVVGSLSALQVNDGLGTDPETGPAVAAARLFDDLLESLDIRITDSARSVGGDEDLTDAQTIASISSPPLSDIVFQMLAANDAGAAELLLKELAADSGQLGTTQAGAGIVQRVLRDQGVTVAIPFRDGSGVDPVGGTTCDQLVATLDAVPDGHATLGSLPSYDLPGVAAGRLQAVDISSDLRAIGGIQGDASGLVARTVDPGRRVTIASIVNRSNGPREADLAFQDALVAIVDDLRATVDIDLVSDG